MGIYLSIKKRKKTIDYIFVDNVSKDCYENALFRLTFKYDTLKEEEIERISGYLQDMLMNLVDILNGNGDNYSDILSRLELLEQKEDHDTIYDDTELNEKINSLEESISTYQNPSNNFGEGDFKVRFTVLNEDNTPFEGFLFRPEQYTCYGINLIEGVCEFNTSKKALEVCMENCVCAGGRLYDENNNLIGNLYSAVGANANDEKTYYLVEIPSNFEVIDCNVELYEVEEEYGYAKSFGKLEDLPQLLTITIRKIND